MYYQSFTHWPPLVTDKTLCKTKYSLSSMLTLSMQVMDPMEAHTFDASSVAEYFHIKVVNKDKLASITTILQLLQGSRGLL